MATNAYDPSLLTPLQIQVLSNLPIASVQPAALTQGPSTQQMDAQLGGPKSQPAQPQGTWDAVNNWGGNNQDMLIAALASLGSSLGSGKNLPQALGSAALGAVQGRQSDRQRIMDQQQDQGYSAILNDPNTPDSMKNLYRALGRQGTAALQGDIMKANVLAGNQQALAQVNNDAELQRQLAIAQAKQENWVDVGMNAAGQILQKNTKTGMTRAVGSPPGPVIYNGGQTALDKGLQDLDVKTVGQYQGEAQAAQQQLSQIDALQDALKKAPATGSVIGSVIQYASPVLTALGIDAGQSEQQIALGLQNVLSTANLPQGSASDADVRMAKAAVAGTDKTPEANAALVRVLKNIAQYKVDRYQNARSYLSKNGSLQGWSMPNPGSGSGSAPAQSGGTIKIDANGNIIQ